MTTRKPKNTTNETPKPSRWIVAGLWRKVLPHERPTAAQLRCALAFCELYPTADQNDRPELAQMEANDRALLKLAANELDATDLRALASAARLLLLVERAPDFFPPADAAPIDDDSADTAGPFADFIDGLDL